jgi:hypothetical protein
MPENQDIDPSIVLPEDWASNQRTTPPSTEKLQVRDNLEITKEKLSVLPEDFRGEVSGFFKDIATTILAQSTRLSGNEVSYKVNDKDMEHYREVFKQIIESDILNPHSPTRKEIK